MHRQWLRFLGLAVASLRNEQYYTYDALDGFQGAGEFKKVLASAGLKVAKFDLLLGDDCMTDEGKITFARLCLQCKRESIVLLGPPCAYFIYLSRVRHGKTKARPAGNASGFSREGNAVAFFMAFAIWLCSLLELSLVIEQPQTSVLWFNKFVGAALRRARASRVAWRMGALGAPSPKPSIGFFLNARAADTFRRVALRKCRLQRTRLAGAPRAYCWGAQGDLRANPLNKRSQI